MLAGGETFANTDRRRVFQHGLCFHCGCLRHQRCTCRLDQPCQIGAWHHIIGDIGAEQLNGQNRIVGLVGIGHGNILSKTW